MKSLGLYKDPEIKKEVVMNTQKVNLESSSDINHIEETELKVPRKSEGNIQVNNRNPISDPLYQCPMKCEGEKTYSSQGKCPVSGMDLVPVGGGHIFY